MPEPDATVSAAAQGASIKKHFEALDGLRGLAAWAVVLFHCFNIEDGFIPNGPIAVDLFFILSGFVIAYSYGDKLLGKMSPVEFMKRRVIRLYPMIVVGAAGGMAIALIHNVTNPAEAYPVRAVLASGGLSLLALPYLAAGSLGAAVFSFNPPIWSLFFELVANLVYGFVRPLMKIWVLVAVVVASLLAVGFGGELGGGSKGNFWLGFPRVAAGFFGGILLFEIWRKGLLARLKIPFLVAFLPIAAILVFPKIIQGWWFLPTFAILMLVIGSMANIGASRASKLYTLLGKVSYPLYLTHWLTMYVVTFLGGKVGLVGDKYVFVAIAQMIIAPIVAYGFHRLYEAPILKYFAAKPDVPRSQLQAAHP